jgi:hypothetical protein
VTDATGSGHRARGQVSPYWDPPRRREESESSARAAARRGRRQKTPTVGRFVVRRLLITGAALLVTFVCVALLVDAAMPDFPEQSWPYLPGFDTGPTSNLDLFWSSFWRTLGDGSAHSLASHSVAVGFIGILIGVGLGSLVRLALRARLPRWLETSIPVVLAFVGALVLLWLLPTVERHLPSQINASSYYLHWPRLTEATPSQSWEGVLRSGLLVGLVLGGALAVGMLVVMRSAPALTGRQVWARLLGRWWPLQAFMGAWLIQLVLLAEWASHYDAGLSRWLGTTLTPGWLETAELWLAVFWAVALNALLLGLVSAALDPVLVCGGSADQAGPDASQALPGVTP